MWINGSSVDYFLSRRSLLRKSFVSDECPRNRSDPKSLLKCPSLGFVVTVGLYSQIFPVRYSRTSDTPILSYIMGNTLIALRVYFTFSWIAAAEAISLLLSRKLGSQLNISLNRRSGITFFNYSLLCSTAMNRNRMGTTQDIKSFTGI